MLTASAFVTPGVVILLFALIWWKAKKAQEHMEYPEFRQRFAKLPKVEGTTRERFR